MSYKLYTRDDGIRYITDPGMFEGEPVWTPSLYVMALDDASDVITRDDCSWFGLVILTTDDIGTIHRNTPGGLTDEEIRILCANRGVIVHQRSDGFVSADVREDGEILGEWDALTDALMAAARDAARDAAWDAAWAAGAAAGAAAGDAGDAGAAARGAAWDAAMADEREWQRVRLRTYLTGCDDDREDDA